MSEHPTDNSRTGGRMSAAGLRAAKDAHDQARAHVLGEVGRGPVDADVAVILSSVVEYLVRHTPVRALEYPSGDVFLDGYRCAIDTVRAAYRGEQ